MVLHKKWQVLRSCMFAPQRRRCLPYLLNAQHLMRTRELRTYWRRCRRDCALLIRGGRLDKHAQLCKMPLKIRIDIERRRVVQLLLTHVYCSRFNATTTHTRHTHEDYYDK